MRESDFAKVMLVAMTMAGHSPISAMAGVIVAGGMRAAPLWLVKEVQATWPQVVASWERHGVLGLDLTVRRIARAVEADPELMALAKKLL